MNPTLVVVRIWFSPIHVVGVIFSQADLMKALILRIMIRRVGWAKMKVGTDEEQPHDESHEEVPSLAPDSLH